MLPSLVDVTNGQAGIQWTDIVFDKPDGAGQVRCRYRGLEAQAHPGDYGAEGESDYHYLFCDDGSAPGEEVFIESARLEVGYYDTNESSLELSVELSCVDANCIYAEDTDKDGYFPVNSCVVGAGVDCNDNNPDVFRCGSECVDNDGDGFFVGCDQYLSRPEDCWDDGGPSSALCTVGCTAPYTSCRLDVCGANGDELKRPFYIDADGDGWGASESIALYACDRPAGYADFAGDCNDDPNSGGALQYPTAPELCDEIDNDCNGVTDDGIGAEYFYADSDRDGYGGSEATKTLSCSDLGDGWSLTFGDCDDENEDLWTNCSGADPGPLVSPFAPELLPDGRWRVGVRFFDRFGVDWMNASLSVAGVTSSEVAQASENSIAAVVTASEGATITLNGAVSSVQDATRPFTFTQSLMTLSIESESEAHVDVDSVTVENWERASSRGRPGYLRSLGGATQLSTVSAGELAYDFYYKNRTFGVSQADNGLESSVLEFASGGRGGLDFELRRLYSSASVYTHEVRPEINAIASPILSQLASNVDCGPNGDEPCAAVDAAMRTFEHRLVDSLVLTAEASCARVYDRWVEMMKLGGQRGWIRNPIPDDVEDLECGFVRVTRGIASEFKAGNIDFDTVLLRLGRFGSTELLSHDDRMPVWPKADRPRNGTESVWCDPGIPGFDATDRCEGEEPTTYVSDLNGGRVLVRQKAIEWDLIRRAVANGESSLRYFIGDDEQPVLADVPCSIAMAEQKELYDDYRPRFSCGGEGIPTTVIQEVTGRILPWALEAISTIGERDYTFSASVGCTSATQRLCDEEKREDHWVQLKVPKSSGDARILTRPITQEDVFPSFVSGVTQLPEEINGRPAKPHLEVIASKIDTYRARWRDRPDGQETEALSAARRIEESFRNGRKTPVHTGLYGGWSFNLPYLILPAARASDEPTSSDRLGELHFGDGVAEFANKRAAIFPNIDGILVRLDGYYLDIDEFVDPVSEAACSGELPDPEREAFDCLRTRYGSHLSKPGAYLFNRDKPVIRGVQRDDVEYKLTVRDRIYFFDLYGRLRYITEPTLSNVITVDWLNPAPLTADDALANLAVQTITDAANNVYEFEYYDAGELTALRAQVLLDAGLAPDTLWLRDLPPVLKRIQGPEKTATYRQRPWLPESALSTANERWVLESVTYDDISGTTDATGAIVNALTSYTYETSKWFECSLFKGFFKVKQCDLSPVLNSNLSHATEIFAPLLKSETGPAGGTVTVTYEDTALQGEVPNSSSGTGCNPRAEYDGRGSLGVPYLPPLGYESEVGHLLPIHTENLAGGFICDATPFYYVDHMPRVSEIRRVDLSGVSRLDGQYSSTQNGRTKAYSVAAVDVDTPPPLSIFHETPLSDESWVRSQWTYALQNGRMGEARVPRLVEHRSDAFEYAERVRNYTYDEFGNVTQLTERHGGSEVAATLTVFEYKPDSLEESVYGSAYSVSEGFQQERRKRFFEYLDYAPWLVTKAWGDQAHVVRGFSDGSAENPGGALKPTVVRVGLGHGLTHNYRYDSFGSLIRESLPGSGERVYDYSTLNGLPSGQLNKLTLRSVDGSERVEWDYAFDSKLRLMSLTDGRNRQLAWSYDGFSRLATYSDPEYDYVFEYRSGADGAWTRRKEGGTVLAGLRTDEFGRVAETLSTGQSLDAQLLSRSELFAYDRLDRLVTRSVRGPGGSRELVMSRSYDQFGRVRSFNDGIGAEARYHYDDRVDHRRVDYIDPTNRSYRSELNPFGQVTSDQYGEYGYTKSGQLEWSRNREGTVVRNLRDEAERVVSTLTYGTNPELQHDPSELDYRDCANVPIDFDCDHVIYSYERGRWQPTRVTDGKGNQIYLEYDGLGRLLKQTDDESVVEAYTYDEAGSPSGWSRGLRSRGFDYDYRGRLRRVDEGSLSSTAYGYDARGRLSTITDLLAGTLRHYAYDPLGRAVGEQDEDGDQFEVTYHPVYGMPTVVRDGRGTAFERRYSYFPNSSPKHAPYRVEEFDSSSELLFVFSYDRLGRELSKSTTASTKLWERSFDSFGNVHRRTTFFDGPQTTSLHYDRVGRLTHTVSPELRTIRLSRDYRGRVTERARYRAANANGDVGEDFAAEKWAYDQAGNLKSETTTLGGVTAYRYDGANRLAGFARADEDEVTVAHSSDESETTWSRSNGDAFVEEIGDAGELVSRTDPSGFREHFLYTTWGAVRQRKYGRVADWAQAATTTFGFHPDRRLASVTQPDGGVESFTYDPAGNLKTRTALSGLVDTYLYDAPFDDVLSVTNSASGETRYEYDDRRRVTSVSKAFGSPSVRTTRFTFAPQKVVTTIDGAGNFGITEEFDQDGFVIAMVNTDGDRSEYAYNGRGELDSVTTPAGHVSKYVRNNAGQLLSHTLDDVSVGAAYAYDGFGRIRAEVRGGGSITYGYDRFGRVKSRTSQERVIGFKYYGNDQLERINWTTNESTTYQYDARGHVAKVVATGRPTVEFRRDALGRVLTDSVGGVVQSSATYYSDGGYSSLNGTSFIRNPTTKRLSSIQLDGGDALTVSYSVHDELETAATKDGYSVSRTFDSTGRMTGESDSTGWSWHETNWDGRRRATAGQTPNGRIFAKTEDVDGRLSTYADGLDDLSFEYDGSSNVTDVTVTAGTASVSADTFDVHNRADGDSYDGEDRQLSLASGQQTYAFDGRVATIDGNSLEYDAAGRLMLDAAGRKPVHHDIDIVGYEEASGAYHDVFAEARGRAPFAQSAGNSFQLLRSWWGSTVATMSSSGAILGETSWSPFGQRVFSSGVQHPLGFKGYWDAGVGETHYAYARVYDASERRFSEVDPILGVGYRPSTMSRRSSFEGNPLEMTDILGLSTCGGNASAQAPNHIYACGLNVATGIGSQSQAPVFRETNAEDLFSDIEVRSPQDRIDPTSEILNGSTVARTRASDFDVDTPSSAALSRAGAGAPGPRRTESVSDSLTSATENLERGSRVATIDTSGTGGFVDRVWNTFWSVQSVKDFARDFGVGVFQSATGLVVGAGEAFLPGGGLATQGLELGRDPRFVAGRALGNMLSGAAQTVAGGGAALGSAFVCAGSLGLLCVPGAAGASAGLLVAANGMAGLAGGWQKWTDPNLKMSSSKSFPGKSRGPATEAPKAGGAAGARSDVVKVKDLFGRQGPREFTGNKIRRFRRQMERDGGYNFDPIDIAEVNGRRIIIDGHHRARAAGAAGIREVPVRIHRVDPDTALRLEMEAAEATDLLGLPWYR